MEDEYELISKYVLSQLRDENIILKKENLELKSKSKINQNLEKVEDKENRFSEIIFTIQEEAKKEREEIFKQLNQIKDLNEKTLSNTLSKSESHDNKFENMISTMKDLVTSLNDVLVEVEKNDEDDFKAILIDIKKSFDENNNKLQGVELINKQLKDIELFMGNLRTLLSYVKVNDLSLNK